MRMYFDHGKATLKSASHGRLVSAAALFAIAAAGPGPAGASTVDVFLIASHTSPTTSSAAPFTLETSSVYQLGGLNDNDNRNKVARSATLIDNFTFDVGAPLSYNNHTQRRLIDEHETGAGAAALVDAEVGTWDDVGITGSGGVDKNLNLGRGAWVTFSSVVGGFTDLILAESGALTPFKLSLCPDAVCSTAKLIFAEFTGGMQKFLLGLPEFAANESSDQGEMDQAFLFRFSEPIFDYVRVTEFGDRKVYTGDRLAVDFIGVGGSAPVSPAPVPGPAGLPLLATGLALLGWLRRPRRSA